VADASTMLARIGRSLLAAVLGLLVLAAAAQAADPLPKAISMSGPQPLREDSHPNDYRYWGNRQYFKDSHRVGQALGVVVRPAAGVRSHES